jgi:hypothetical protein
MFLEMSTDSFSIRPSIAAVFGQTVLVAIAVRLIQNRTIVLERLAAIEMMEEAWPIEDGLAPGSVFHAAYGFGWPQRLNIGEIELEPDGEDDMGRAFNTEVKFEIKSADLEIDVACITPLTRGNIANGRVRWIIEPANAGADPIILQGLDDQFL